MSGDLIIVGLSHHTAPVEVRERLATDDAHVPAELQSLVTEAGLHEALLLSTCNRVELYAHASEPHRAMEQARAHFHARAGDGVLSCLYQHRGADAQAHPRVPARHLTILVRFVNAVRREVAKVGRQPQEVRERKLVAERL